MAIRVPFCNGFFLGIRSLADHNASAWSDCATSLDYLSFMRTSVGGTVQIEHGPPFNPLSESVD